jgi:hypothetical protein
MVVEGIERRFDLVEPARSVCRLGCERELPQPSWVGVASGEIGDRRDRNSS